MGPRDTVKTKGPAAAPCVAFPAEHPDFGPRDWLVMQLDSFGSGFGGEEAGSWDERVKDRCLRVDLAAGDLVSTDTPQDE